MNWLKRASIAWVLALLAFAVPAYAQTIVLQRALTPVVSSAAEASHVLKASPGNLYSLTVTSGASAGFVLLFNLTAAPANGAVTPQNCVVIAANSTVSIGAGGDPPSAYSVGIVAEFSTTGCFTATSSATAFFAGNVQ